MLQKFCACRSFIYKCTAEIINGTWNLITGEFLFETLRTANGGLIIILRSLIIALFALGGSYIVFWLITKNFHEHVDPIWWECNEFKAPWKWIGVIFSAAYINLYTRFSSQWKYLADLYNNISRMEVQIELTQQTYEKQVVRSEPEAMIYWKASFIVDAYRLHMSRKPMFYSCIKSFLENPRVDKYFSDGNSMLSYDLIKDMKKTIRHKKKGRIINFLCTLFESSCPRAEETENKL